MGEFASGKWIIFIVIYFFMFFIIMQSAVNAQNEIIINQDSLEYEDLGFQSQENFFGNNDIVGCVNGGNSLRAMSPFGVIQCGKLIDMEEESCNNITNCQWENETNLFNITIRNARCFGIVNKTDYSIVGSFNTYCNSTFLQSQEFCNMFDCEWINPSSVAENRLGYNSAKSPITIWETVKWVATFQADIGLPIAFNWIFIFIFFYIPFIMLIWSLYMAMPFLH